MNNLSIKELLEVGKVRLQALTTHNECLKKAKESLELSELDLVEKIKSSLADQKLLSLMEQNDLVIEDEVEESFLRTFVRSLNLATSIPEVRIKITDSAREMLQNANFVKYIDDLGLDLKVLFQQGFNSYCIIKKY